MAATEGRSPLVAAIVLNYNLPEVTEWCVASLLQSDYDHLHLIIVDNGSQDGSAEVLRGRFPQATLLVSDRNLLFAGGMNLGLRHALAMGADYALVLNNDTVVSREMVKRLVEAAISLPQAGIVAPLIRRADGRVWSAGSQRRGVCPFPRDVGQGKGAVLPSQPFRIDYVTGCAMLIHHDVLEAIGLFDERYAMYYEDADFCVRAASAGYTLWVVPSAEMVHLVSESAKRQAPQSVYAHTRYRLRFYRQHHQPLWWVGLPSIFFQEGLRAVRDILAGHRHLALARLRGMRDGLTEDLSPKGE